MNSIAMHRDEGSQGGVENINNLMVRAVNDKIRWTYPPTLGFFVASLLQNDSIARLFSFLIMSLRKGAWAIPLKRKCYLVTIWKEDIILWKT